jgi:lipopolysaccharide transport protein LptA
MTKHATVAIITIVLTAGPLDAADLLPLSDDTVIMVSADESWEDAEQDIIHFRGNFEIQLPNWTLKADFATVYGELNDPQRVVAEGSPVKFVYHYTETGNPSFVEGEGQRIEYEKKRNLLNLSGAAKLSTDRRVMHSSEIKYNLDQQKLEAGGPEGVQITISPDSTGHF